MFSHRVKNAKKLQRGGKQQHGSAGPRLRHTLLYTAFISLSSIPVHAVSCVVGSIREKSTLSSPTTSSTLICTTTTYRRENTHLRISRHERSDMGRSDGAVHGIGEDTAQPGDVSQIPVRRGVVVRFLRRAGRGGPEATSVGRARGWAKTVADRRGLHILPGTTRERAIIIILRSSSGFPTGRQ